MKSFAAILIFLIVQVVSAKECESEKVIQNACAHFKKNKHQAFIKMKDGTRYRNPLFETEKLKIEEPEITEAQKARLKRIFEDAKQGIREKIKNGVKEDKLSAERKNLLKRIDAVQLGDPDERPREVSINCMNDPYNAFYIHQNHHVSFCNGYYEYPEEVLLFLMGHEISHSIDPCKSQAPLYKVSRDYIDQRNNGNESAFGQWDQYFLENDHIHISAVGGYKDLFSPVPADKADAELIAGAFNEKNHPYSEVQSCLINQKKFHKSLAKKIDPDNCNQDQINEVLSDAYGSWAFTDKAGKYETSDSLFALVSALGPDVCDPTATTIKSAGVSGEHPSTHKRFRDVILQSPELRQAFSCAPDQSEPCLKPVNGKNSAQSSSKTQNKR